MTSLFFVFLRYGVLDCKMYILMIIRRETFKHLRLPTNILLNFERNSFQTNIESTKQLRCYSAVCCQEKGGGWGGCEATRVLLKVNILFACKYSAVTLWPILKCCKKYCLMFGSLASLVLLLVLFKPSAKSVNQEDKLPTKERSYYPAKVCFARSWLMFLESLF